MSKRFDEAANSLRDKLVDMSIEESEVEANIEAEQPDLADGLLGRQSGPRPTLTVVIKATRDEAKVIERAAPGKITVAPDASGKATVQIKGVPMPREKEGRFAQAPERFYGALRDKIQEW